MTTCIVSILPLRPVDSAYHYQAETDIAPGTLVQMPLGRGNKSSTGIVWQDNNAPPVAKKLKKVSEVSELPPLNQTLFQFIQWVSAYTMIPLGQVARMAVPVPDLFKVLKQKRKIIPTAAEQQQAYALHCQKRAPLTFRPEQQQAANALTQAVESKSFTPFVLDGVTGSGKTAVYLSAVETAWQAGQQALVLMPEISLTNQVVNRIKERFGVAPLIWHSTMTPAKRRETFKAILRGEPRIVIGARSALFLPFQNLGVIVIDEEHDGSYKQEEGGSYHARDLAIKRAQMTPCPIVLASATPSLETYLNARDGRYTRLHLPSRYAQHAPPVPEVLDMRTAGIPSTQFLHPDLVTTMTEHLNRGEQVMLYLNRRGFAPLTLCRACGHRLQCPNCSAWMTAHKHTKSLMCHHCGTSIVTPKSCPHCQAEDDTLAACGPGVERIAEEVEALIQRGDLPKKAVALFSSDTHATPQQQLDVLEKIRHNQTPIVIGTQILAKGHHFPHLTLVGVVDADLGLGGGDLRASERTYQLLHQVAGRAGREEKQGRVLLQSYQPDHRVIQALCNAEREAFLETELTEREMTGLPPYGRLVTITAQSPDPEAAEKQIRLLAQNAPQPDADDTATPPKIMVLGPSQAPIFKLRNNYRFRLILRTDRAIMPQKIIRDWLAHTPAIGGKTRILVDVDPYGF